MKLLEMEALFADRESVKGMLDRIGENDPVGRISFAARLSSIEQQIQQLSQTTENIGSVALMFSGKPVHGSRSIDAEFAPAVIRSFHDLVGKRVATDEFGRLGSRGRIPERSAWTFAIREIVRGSVGFVLEERCENGELVDTVVKSAIDDVTELISQAAAESEDRFESSVENLDPRMMVSLRDFFRALDDGDAAIRIVEDRRDEMLDTQAVHRARLRVDAIDVEDEENDTVVGELLGLLPEARRFELKLSGTGEVIRGKVSALLASDWLEMIEKPNERLVGQLWRTKMRIREIRERNRSPRRLYTLLGLLEKL